MAVNAKVEGEKTRQYLYEPALIQALNRYFDDPVLKQHAPTLYKMGQRLKQTTIHWGRKMRSAYLNKNIDPRLGRLVADIANSPALFSLRFVDDKKVYKQILQFLEKHESNPAALGLDETEFKQMQADYETLHAYGSDTAYITPTVNDNKEIRFTIVLSRDLIDRMNRVHNSDETQVDRAIIGAAVPHEFQHYQRGDIKPWLGLNKEEQYKNLTHFHFNVLQDAMINGPLLRNFTDDARALLDHIGVRGKTLQTFLTDAYAIQTAYDMLPEVKKKYDLNNNDHLKEIGVTFLSRFGDMLKNELNLSDDQVGDILKHYRGKKPGQLEKLMKAVFKNMDEKLKGKTVEEFFSDLNSQYSQHLKQMQESKTLSTMNIEKITQPRDVPTLIARNTLNFEEKLDHTQVGNWWFKLYDRLRELWPKMGEGGGGKKGGEGKKGSENTGNCPSGSCPTPVPGQGHNNPAEEGAPVIVVTEEEEKEDAKRRQAAEEAFRERHRQTLNEMSPYGSVDMELQLEYDPDIRFKNTIKAAIRTALELPEIAYDKKILPIINEPIRQGTTVTMAGQNVQIGQPKGVITTSPSEKPAPKIIFAVIDESGSHGSVPIQKSLSAIADICKEENAVAVVAHMSADPADARFSAYDPKTTDLKEFLRLKVSGGTNGFHELIYNMDDLITKHETFKRRLDEALQKYNIRGDKGVVMSSSDVLRAYKRGSLAGLIITDGYISGGRQPTKKELDKWLAYAENKPHPPVAIVTTSGHQEYPFQAPASVLRKLFVYYSV